MDSRNRNHAAGIWNPLRGMFWVSCRCNLLVMRDQHCTFIATFTKSARQAQLTLFLVNPTLDHPLLALRSINARGKRCRNGSSPVAQSIPSTLWQISRGAMLKGSGIETLWQIPRAGVP